MTIQWDELRAAYDAWRAERDKQKAGPFVQSTA